VRRLLKAIKKEYIMKNILLGLIISVMSIPAFAGSFNGNLSYNSDYVWRGVSQTQGKPSVHLQGEVISDLGFYAGFYGATVDFVSEVDTDVELDYYAGYDLQVSDNIALDVGYVRYTYDAVIESFEEVYAILSIGGFTVEGYQDIETNDNYAQVSYEFGWLVGNTFDLRLIHGLHDLEGTEDFTQLRVGKTFGASQNWDFGVTIGQDVFEDQVADSIFASLTYNFGRSF
jgi:uncharacterized protein (TIGR02001 family)